MFSDTFYPPANGIFTSIANSTCEMVKRGHEIIIFVPRSEKMISLGRNVRIVPIDSFCLPKYKDYRIPYPNFVSCLKEIHKFKPDVIHIHSPFLIGLMGVICSKYVGIPLVGTYHTFFSEFLKHSPIPGLRNRKLTGELTGKYANFIYNKCNLVIAPSKVIKSELIFQGIARPIEVISNGIDSSKFHIVPIKGIRKKYGLKGKYILHFGRISYEKEIETVIKSFKLALKKNPKLTLVIAGKGPALASLKEQAKSSGIYKNTIFTGFVPDNDLPGLISGAEFFVTASPIETQGLAILEAMACGLPVIGVDSLAVPELVVNGKTGYLAKPKDYRKINEHILKLSSNDSLRKSMSNNALKMTEQHSMERVQKQLEDLYFSLSQSKKVKSGI
ncbi:MAG: glycosyltransferase [Nitrospirae bacterium]|nr:glycosyltransferase [Nitrospirota bacterium]